MTPPTAIRLPGLNAAQHEAVTHVEGPLLVLAGAGSGKTRVLTARIAHLIHAHGVAPDRIFAVTFTNRAAGEMKARVAALLDRDPVGLWIGTFHSLSARLLRREAERIGFRREFTIYDEDDRLAVIKRLLEARGYDPKRFPPKLIQYLISGAKNQMTSPEALAHSAQGDLAVRAAADVYAALGEALRAANAMDFDDLLLHPLTLFRDHPDRLAVYQRKFQYVLVDEFQDTNRAQYHLIRHLGLGHRNVCVVGDDDQSIYGWRGADVRNMRAFREDFAGTRLITLEQNYRSTQVILDAANAAIADNTNRLGKTLRTERRGGELVTLVVAADERDEAEWLAGEVSRRMQRDDLLPRDVGILYRTNAQSRAFEEAFRRRGIPYRLVGAVSFYERREVKDLLAYLRLIVNPADNVAFLRAIATPKRGVGDSSLSLLAEQAAQWGLSLHDAALRAEGIPSLRPNVRAACVRFTGFLAALRESHGREPPATVLEELITGLDIKAHLLAEGSEGEERWDNVRELMASAAAWSELAGEEPLDVEDGGEPAPPAPLERFLANAALIAGDDKRTGTDDGVSLMTVHTAKGLEWPVVAVAGLEKGLFPLSRAMETQEGIEEERRLFYVGMTRAQRKLFLSWARQRRRGGSFMPGTASPFLDALPPRVVEEQRTSSIWRPATRWAGAGAPRDTASWREGARRRSASEALAGEEELSQDAPRLVKGERVRHRTFGTGTIQAVSGVGKHLTVSIAFDDIDVGVKALVVSYAGLERAWDGA